MVKKRASKRRLPLAFFLLVTFSLFLTQCSSPKKLTPPPKYEITKEERIWLQEFFRDLLFKHPGAYTLFGTKPISDSCIYHLTEDDRKEMEEYYKTLSDEERAQMKKKRYDYDSNYAKWQEIKNRFQIRQYLFGAFSCSSDEKVEILLFVNIEETLRTLLKFYEDFRRVLGFEFDPFLVVFEVENRDSKFWNGVMHSHDLQGVLLGFGRDNAWFFEQEMKYKEEQNRKGEFLRTLPITIDEDGDIDEYGPKHFLLPIFGSYGLHPDKQLLEKYKKERKRIKALYKGRDEVDVALEWLTR